MPHPILAFFNLGGGEIILILAMLLILGLGAAALIVLLIVSSSRKNSRAPSLGASAEPPDLEQQLRTLAKLKAEGVITEEDFNAKKKALLGL
jgi:hypothetical protein